MPAYQKSIIGFWQDFSGGHWGNLGPEHANGNQWGGVNMIPTRDGGITPMCASRDLTLANSVNGVVWGVFWAWGADGRIYYLQNGASSTTTTTTTATVFRFTPDVDSIPLTQVDVGGVVIQPTVAPDWAGVGTSVYLTNYADKTYTINTASATLTKLTGTYGDAPAGRAIALFGERLVIGGISDTRFGTHPNRLVFSGDDTNNDPTLKTAWETLNFFDVGADSTLITGLYPIRDHLIVVLQDQQIYLVTGVLGTSAVARRVYGFHKGSGAITAYVASNGASDPGQTAVWMFDHTERTAQKLTGVQLQRVTQFGAPHADRTGTDVFEGSMAMIGGPDEFLMHGIVASRLAGEGVINKDLELLRIGGAYAIAQADVIGLRS